MLFNIKRLITCLAAIGLVSVLASGFAFAANDDGLRAAGFDGQSNAEDIAIEASAVNTNDVTLFARFVDDEFGDDPDLDRYTNTYAGVTYTATEHDDGHIYYVPVKLLKYTDSAGVDYYFAARPDNLTAQLTLIDTAPASVSNEGVLDTATKFDLVIPAKISSGDTVYTVTAIGNYNGTNYIGIYKGANFENYSAYSVSPDESGNINPYFISSYYDKEARNSYWRNVREDSWPENYFFGAKAGGCNIMDEKYLSAISGNNSDSNTQVFSKQVSSVYIPSTVESIGYRSFWGFSSESIVFGMDDSRRSELRAIDANAFEGNVSVNRIVLPESILTLGTVTYKTFQKTLSSTDYSTAAAYNEDGLDGRYVSGEASNNGNTTNNPSQIVPADQREIGKTEGYVFSGCESLASIDIPYDLNTLANSCFYGTGITSIKLPRTVAPSATALTNALSGMNQLATVEVDPESNEIVESGGLLYNSDGTQRLFMPPATRSITSYPISYTAFESFGLRKRTANNTLNSIVFAEGIETVANNACQYCTALESVHFSKTVSSLGTNLFSNTALKNVTFDEDSILTNCNGVFKGTAISTITLPNSITTLVAYEFSNCASLESVSLGANVSSVGTNAFYGCSHLKTLIFDDAKELSFAESAFDAASPGECVSIYFKGADTSISSDTTAFTSTSFLASGLNVYAASDAVKGFFTTDGNVSLQAGGNDVTVTYTDLNANLVKIGADTTSATLAGVPEEPVQYTGSAIEPEITVTYGADTLVEGTDYMLSYSDNLKPGTATVTVEGMGDYVGTLSTTFQIVDTEDGQAAADEEAVADLLKDIAALPSVDQITADNADGIAAVDAAASAYIAMNDVQKSGVGVDALQMLVEAQAKVAEVKEQIAADAQEQAAKEREAAEQAAAEAKAKAEQLEKDVAAAKAEAAAAKTEAASAKSEASAAKAEAANAKASASTALAKAKLTKKTKSAKKGKVTVAWEKVAGATGYEVKVGAKTYTVKKASTLKKTVKAAKGKKVKVRVRAFKKQGDNTLYGPWSAAKKVKVKK